MPFHKREGWDDVRQGGSKVQVEEWGEEEEAIEEGNMEDPP